MKAGARGQEHATEYLEAHELTRRLDRLGVTREQRQSMQFTRSCKGQPFAEWTTCRVGEIPPDALLLIKPYCALKWLILEDPPESRDTDEAWTLVSAAVAAPIIEIGLRTKRAQSERAKKPRSRVTDFGETLEQLIAELALDPQHRDSTAKDLWPHFFAELDTQELNPEEVNHPLDVTKCGYMYDFGSGRKKITFGRFANIVSQARRKKSR